MKSLISNYLNSRRSIKLEEAVLGVDTIEKKAKDSDNDTIQLINKIATNDIDRLENRISDLNLKYIDDIDTDSASITSRSQNANSGYLETSKISSEEALIDLCFSSSQNNLHSTLNLSNLPNQSIDDCVTNSLQQKQNRIKIDEKCKCYFLHCSLD